MPGMDLGIDLGTSQVVIYTPHHGIVLREPSVIAVDQADGHMIACGKEAYAMLGRTPDSICAIRPLRKGVISDYDYAEQMLRYFVRKVCKYKILKPRAAVSVPATVTEVEQRSVVEAVSAAGIRRVVLMEESVAAAVGAGLDVSAPRGSMIVDLGAGTTDIAVMSLKGLANSISIRLGGDDFDAAIVRYMRTQYGLIIGDLTAEQVKKTIGNAMPAGEPDTMPVRGRDALSGLPRVQKVDANEILEAISEPLYGILSAIQHVLETTQPELVGDILDNGITLSGGGALLKNMPERVTRRTGVACRVADDPESCVAIGTGKALKYVGVMANGVYDINQFAYRLSDSIPD